jgi:hypothetical protein
LGLFALSASAPLPGWWLFVLLPAALAAPALLLRSPAKAIVTSEAPPPVLVNVPRLRLNRPALTGCAIGIVCLTGTLEGQGLSRYRSFELGSSLASVSTLAGVAPSEAKTIHRRPALRQDLEWRLSHWIGGSTAASTDPVEVIGFSFYDDRLFQIVVDYGHERTEGLTRADMIEAISAVYGAPHARTSRPASHVASRLEIDSGSPVAAWGDADDSVVLYQSSTYGTAFRMIVTDIRLEALARKADAQAVRLDDQEAPRREIARLKKEQDDARTAADKARIANKAVFRP